MNHNLLKFLAGFGAGIGLGMLMAPRSGVRTRLLLRDKANEGAEYLRQRGYEARDAATQAIRDSARRVTKEADAVKSAIEAGRQAYSQSIQS